MSSSQADHQSRNSFLSLLPLPNRGELPLALLFWVATVAVYLLLRLANLKIIPIFTDEAIYLRWAQIALRDPQFRFISLTDGKQPLYVWLAMVAMKWISDPLIAGRVVSGLAGLVSLVAVWLLARELFGRGAGYFATLTYLFLPITLLYDRMALMESLLFTFGTLVVFFGVLLAKHQRLDLAMILGVLLGGALLTKSSALFYLYLFPISLLFFPWSKPGRLKKFGEWLVLAGVVFFFSQVFFNIQRLSPWYGQISTKEETFVISFSELKTDPWRWLPGNLGAFRHWVIGYLTWPVVMLVLLGTFWQLTKNLKQVFLLAVYFGAPLLISAAFGKVIYARYLMFFIMPLLVLAGRGWWQVFSWLTGRLKLSWFSAGLLTLAIFLPVLRTDYFLLTNPPRADIPDNDKNQYIDAWPSGYGVAEVVEFLREKTAQGQVTIATEGTFGLMPYSLELYLVDHPNLEILPYWPVDKIPEEVLARAQKQPTYFVFNDTQEVSPALPLQLVKAYPKGNGKDFMRLFKVVANPEKSKVSK